MKKIPTLFKRVFEGHKIVDILDEITPGCEEAFRVGTPTIKLDGACCAIIDGVFYKRYDAKKGKTPPEGAIPCSDPDPITGHWPHWVKVDPNSPGDKWFMEAYKFSLDIDRMKPKSVPESKSEIRMAHPRPGVERGRISKTLQETIREDVPLTNGTYEAIGPHFNGNPYQLEYDTLVRHGEKTVNSLPRDFDSVKRFLETIECEGLVFWLNGEPVCKIKRTDFGLKWPVK